MQISHRLRRIAALLLPVAAGLAVAPGTLAQGTQTANVQSVVALSSPGIDLAPRGVRGDFIQADDQNIYFVSSGGGEGIGAVSRITPDGTLGVLYAMDSFDQGANSFARLTQGSDRHLYGTTFQGGARGAGVVFRVSLEGEYALLHTFDNRERGAFFPYTGLVEGPDGLLYGTTLRGGTRDMGTVYSIGRDGTGFTVIHQFEGDTGSSPEGTLIVGPDGLLYGTTMMGGSSNRGVLYRISTAGVVERLYSFPSLSAFTAEGMATNATGANPRAGLIIGSDGNFYGTAYQGGAHGYGTMFRMSPTGDVTTVHDFTGPFFGGGFPMAGVTQGPDGAFYGTSQRGGYVDQGSVWRVDAAGNFSLLHGFTGSGIEGSAPHAGVLFAHDSLYAVSFTDNLSGAGAIIKLHQAGPGTPLPIQLNMSAREILASQSVTITWDAPGAESCTKTGGWTGDTTASGSESPTLISPGVYVYGLRCVFPGEVFRFAYAGLSVQAPPQQPVDGGGGAGSLPVLLLLLFAGLLTRKFIKETA